MIRAPVEAERSTSGAAVLRLITSIHHEFSNRMATKEYKLDLPIILSAISGALLALCLPRPGLCPLGWFAIAPLLFLATRASSYRRCALIGWLFGFGFWGTGFYWVYSTCRFAEIPRPAAFLAWALMCGIFALSWALFAGGVRWAWKSFAPQSWPWMCALMWTALEFVCDRFFPYIGALPLGYTQWRYLSLIQGISWAGPHSLGFLIILINGIWALAATSRLDAPDLRQRRSFVVTSRAAIGICLAWWGMGLWTLSGRVLSEAAGTLRRVAILQPDVDQYHKWDEKFANEIRANIGELTTAAAQRHPNLIVWPESSLPDWLDAPENKRWLGGLFKKDQTYQLIGALTRTQPPHSAPGMPPFSDRQYNSAALFDPAGREIGEYHKRRLVPFGEFVPWRIVTSKIIGLFNQMGDLDAGSLYQIPLPAPMGRLGLTICYEAVFPSLSRLNAAAGADVLVNLTNDGWYKDTWAPYQHFYVNIFRAVENRRPVIRAANTGISGAIDPYGAVIARLDLGQRGVLSAEVPMGLFPEGSFYSRHGDWFGWLCLFGTIAALSAGLWRELIV